MSKWFAGLIVLVLLAVLVSVAAAKPVAMSDGQLAAITAGELEIEDNNVAGVGDDGTAVGEAEKSFNDYSDEVEIEDSLVNGSGTTTITNTDTDVDVDKKDIDLDVDVDDSFNTDNSTDVDVDKKDIDVDVDDSFNTDSSTTTVTKTDVDVDKKDIDVDVDDSFNTKKIKDSFNDNRKMILEDGAQKCARAINLVNVMDGDVGVGTNIFVLAAQSSASSGGNADDAKASICDSSVNQIVANFSKVCVSVVSGVSLDVSLPHHGGGPPQ